VVTVADLSLDNLRSIGFTDVNLVRVPPSFKYPTSVYVISENNGYTLSWKMEESQLTLKDGTQTFGQGYLIYETDTKLGLKFWSTEGLIYSQIPVSLKESVVEGFNQIAQNQDSDSVQGGETGSRPQSLNDRGETVREQREREEREAEEAAEPFFFEPAIVYDETFTHTFENPYGEGVNQTRQRYVIVKTGRGTVGNPNLEFNLYQVQYDANPLGNELYLIQSRYVIWTDSQNPYETLEEAVQIAQNRFNEYVAKEDSQFQESYREAFENRTDIVESEDLELIWKKSNLSFRDMTLRDDLEYSQTAFRKGLEGEERVGGTIYTGDYGDAVKWTNNGNTLELVDFDTPRVTTAGLTRNRSGGIAFTVKQGWKIDFTLKSNSMTFTQNQENELEDSPITVDDRQFRFIMVGGDRIEIDIDNEREGLYPFLITSNGYVWESNTEIDDEVFLTMNSAEQLHYVITKSEKEVYRNPPREGEVKTVISETKTEGLFNSNAPIEGLTMTQDTQLRQQLTELQTDSLTYTRTFGITDVEAEAGFVEQPDVSPSNFLPDNWQVWVIGGVLVVGAFILLGVYLNARGRSGGE